MNAIPIIDDLPYVYRCEYGYVIEPVQGKFETCQILSTDPSRQVVQALDQEQKDLYEADRLHISNVTTLSALPALD